MSSLKLTILVGFVLLILVGLGAAIIIVPNYRQSATINKQTAELRVKVADVDGRTRTVRLLEQQVSRARQRVQQDLKLIPDLPDLAALMRKLSLDVDRKRVLDQTFTAGSPAEAIVGGKASTQAMPLTVDMEATFDSVFALIRNAESMNRLVRVASVRVICKRDEKKPIDPPIVKASVGLEAIYEPPGAIVNVAGAQANASALSSAEGK